ncbi:gfo/Idh/MocA family oxidoreductase [Cohnella endophytica]|uniref:Gfo/Idh/MocA family oxidoreductase n=1 Tax=Cohnella endophytica TaxID=2419778 RepID=A0A494XEW4_9BACL|nr:Gfo/Idh/MocA family oxidoreductase [Cohnella endophytica]RKP46699.1 gfo/Idh/MocA family oxidoreductase [Cohnella endophytica]
MVRFGIIGTNWITDRFVQAAGETGEFELTAVYSRTEQRGNEFGEKYGIPFRYTDLEQFASSSEFDAVYIASPTYMHARQAIACMDGGKHVLCEKPIASNAKEARAMIEAAKRNDVLFMEAMMTTQLPNFEAVREHLGELGTIRRYFASYCQYSSRYDAYKQGEVLNAFDPRFSNGALMDLGVYCLYPLVALFGKPDRIQANAHMLASGVDGEGSILLAYEEMDAVVMYSKISSSYAPAEIQGELATMVIHPINSPESVEIRYRDGSVKKLTRPQDHSFMYYEARNFIDLLKRGEREDATNSWSNSLYTMEVMEEARRQIGLVFPADME